MLLPVPVREAREGGLERREMAKQSRTFVVVGDAFEAY
jgi:hypothetical protein